MNVQLKNFVRPTVIVRSVMRNFVYSLDNSNGFGFIWTNSYEHCRTVKCYGASQQMADAIKQALIAAGVKQFKIKQQKSGALWRPGMVTIVRIPRTEQQ